jgi:hypothetical protein
MSQEQLMEQMRSLEAMHDALQRDFGRSQRACTAGVHMRARPDRPCDASLQRRPASWRRR